MTERAWNVAVRAQGESTLEVAVYDIIGRDFWTGEGITSQDFLDKLRAAPKATKIELRVNSVGGLVDEAKAMGNLLAERAASGVDVVGFVDGIAASSAAFLLTFAKRVVMPSNTFQMIHGVRGGVRGTAEDVESGAKLMRRLNEQLAEAFAAASARRGKAKSKADYLAAFAKGDLYLSADEALEWGLADEKLEATKLAACLADLSAIQDAPAALLAAPFVSLNGAKPKGAVNIGTLSFQAPEGFTPEAFTAAMQAAFTQFTPSSPVARADKPAPNGQQETGNMGLSKIIITALALSEDADDNAAVAAINRLKTSAKVGTEIEALVGATGQAALGAVRALKESNEANAELGTEVAKLKIVNVRRDFDVLVARGTDPKDRKLSPAVAKLYGDRFTAALKLAEGEEGDADAAAAKASDVVADLRGFLAVAPRITAGPVTPPAPGGGQSPTEGAGLQHNGKSFEAMAPKERLALKRDNPDLYTAMRDDAKERGVL